MGRRGPPPTPTRVLQMRGTYRNDRHGGVEPTGRALVKVPPPPKELSDAAKKFWRRVARHLITVKLLTDGDLFALEGYVLAYERATEAEAIVRTEGRTVTTSQGKKRHPELVTAEKARADMRRYEQEFGLTPSARTRVKDAPEAPKDPAADPWAKVGGG